MALIPTTLNPAATSTRLTLSTNELTVTATTAGYSHSKSRWAVTSGKWYLEVYRSDSRLMPGVVPAGADLNMYAGGPSAGVGLYQDQVYRGDAVIATLSGFNVTGWFGLLIDADSRTITYKSPSGAPSSALAIGFSGPIHVATGNGSSSVTGIVSTMNFGQSAFVYLPPAGFTHGFGEVQTFPIYGLVRDASGTPAARVVRFYRRSTGEYLGSVTSDGTTGQFSFNSLYDGEIHRVVLDDDGGTLLNDLIDRVMV